MSRTAASTVVLFAAVTAVMGGAGARGERPGRRLVTCATGQGVDAAGTGCANCVAGTFNDLEAANPSSNPCTICPSGKFQPAQTKTYCQMCASAPNATTALGSTSAAECFCGASHYDSADWLATSSPSLSCRSCPVGAKCSPPTSVSLPGGAVVLRGNTLRGLELREGFWRSSGDSTAIEQCGARFHGVKKACAGTGILQSVTMEFDVAATIVGSGLTVTQIGDAYSIAGNVATATAVEIPHLPATQKFRVTVQSGTDAAARLILSAPSLPSAPSSVSSFATRLTPDTSTVSINYNDNVDAQCATGYKGILCMQCDTGYSQSFNGECNQCDGATTTMWIALGVALFVIVLVIASLYAWYQRDPDGCRGEAQKRNMPFKLLVMYIQILSVLSSTFKIPLPRAVQSFLATLGEISSYIAVLPVFFKFECIGFHITYLERIYGTCIVPIVIFLVLAWYRKATLILFLSFVLYAPMSQAIFSYFDFIEVDGVKYVTGDPTIIKNYAQDDPLHFGAHSDTYLRHRPFFFLMGLLVPLSLPICYTIVLLRQRSALYPRVKGTTDEFCLNIPSEKIIDGAPIAQQDRLRKSIISATFASVLARISHWEDMGRRMGCRARFVVTMNTFMQVHAKQLQCAVPPTSVCVAGKIYGTLCTLQEELKAAIVKCKHAEHDSEEPDENRSRAQKPHELQRKRYMRCADARFNKGVKHLCDALLSEECKNADGDSEWKQHYDALFSKSEKVSPVWSDGSNPHAPIADGSNNHDGRLHFGLPETQKEPLDEVIVKERKMNRRPSQSLNPEDVRALHLQRAVTNLRVAVEFAAHALEIDGDAEFDGVEVAVIRQCLAIALVAQGCKAFERKQTHTARAIFMQAVNVCAEISDEGSRIQKFAKKYCKELKLTADIESLSVTALGDTSATPHLHHRLQMLTTDRDISCAAQMHVFKVGSIVKQHVKTDLKSISGGSRSAYDLFVRERSNMESTDRMDKIGGEWEALSADEKAEYQNRADGELEAYVTSSLALAALLHEFSAQADNATGSGSGLGEEIDGRILALKSDVIAELKKRRITPFTGNISAGMTQKEQRTFWKTTLALEGAKKSRDTVKNTLKALQGKVKDASKDDACRAKEVELQEAQKRIAQLKSEWEAQDGSFALENEVQDRELEKAVKKILRASEAKPTGANWTLRWRKKRLRGRVTKARRRLEAADQALKLNISIAEAECRKPTASEDEFAEQAQAQRELDTFMKGKVGTALGRFMKRKADTAGDAKKEAELKDALEGAKTKEALAWDGNFALFEELAAKKSLSARGEGDERDYDPFQDFRLTVCGVSDASGENKDSRPKLNRWGAWVHQQRSLQMANELSQERETKLDDLKFWHAKWNAGCGTCINACRPGSASDYHTCSEFCFYLSVHEVQNVSQMEVVQRAYQDAYSQADSQIAAEKAEADTAESDPTANRAKNAQPYTFHEYQQKVKEWAVKRVTADVDVTAPAEGSPGHGLLNDAVQRIYSTLQEKVSEKWKACHLNQANATPKQDESLEGDEKEKLYAAHCEQLSIVLTTIAEEQNFKAKEEYVKHLKHAARGSPRSEHLVHWLLNAGDRNKFYAFLNVLGSAQGDSVSMQAEFEPVALRDDVERDVETVYARLQDKVWDQWDHKQWDDWKARQQKPLGAEDERNYFEELYASHCEEFSSVLATIAREKRFEDLQQYVEHLRGATRGSPPAEHMLRWLLAAKDKTTFLSFLEKLRGGENDSTNNDNQGRKLLWPASFSMKDEFRPAKLKVYADALARRGNKMFWLQPATKNLADWLNHLQRLHLARLLPRDRLTSVPALTRKVELGICGTISLWYHSLKDTGKSVWQYLRTRLLAAGKKSLAHMNSDNNWELYFLRLQQYAAKNNGNPNCSFYTVTDDKLRLGVWLHAQRALKAVDKLEVEREAKLNELEGMKWDTVLGFWKPFIVVAEFVKRIFATWNAGENDLKRIPPVGPFQSPLSQLFKQATARMDALNTPSEGVVEQTLGGSSAAAFYCMEICKASEALLHCSMKKSGVLVEAENVSETAKTREAEEATPELKSANRLMQTEKPDIVGLQQQKVLLKKVDVLLGGKYFGLDNALRASLMSNIQLGLPKMPQVAWHKRVRNGLRKTWQRKRTAWLRNLHSMQILCSRASHKVLPERQVVLLGRTVPQWITEQIKNPVVFPAQGKKDAATAAAKELQYQHINSAKSRLRYKIGHLAILRRQKRMEKASKQLVEDRKHEKARRRLVSLAWKALHTKAYLSTHAQLLDTVYSKKVERTGARAAKSWLAVRIRDVNPAAQNTRFLWYPYKPVFFWFEALEMWRKLLVTGLPIMTRTITASGRNYAGGFEIFMGLLLQAIFTGITVAKSPFAELSDQRLMVPSQAHHIVVMICGMVTKFSNSPWLAFLFSLLIIGWAGILFLLLLFRLINPDAYKHRLNRISVAASKHTRLLHAVSAQAGDEDDEDDEDEDEEYNAMTEEAGQFLENVRMDATLGLANTMLKAVIWPPLEKACLRAGFTTRHLLKVQEKMAMMDASPDFAEKIAGVQEACVALFENPMDAAMNAVEKFGDGDDSASSGLSMDTIRQLLCAMGFTMDEVLKMLAPAVLPVIKRRFMATLALSNDQRQVLDQGFVYIEAKMSGTEFDIHGAVQKLVIGLVWPPLQTCLQNFSIGDTNWEHKLDDKDIKAIKSKLECLDLNDTAVIDQFCTLCEELTGLFEMLPAFTKPSTGISAFENDPRAIMRFIERMYHSLGFTPEILRQVTVCGTAPFGDGGSNDIVRLLNWIMSHEKVTSVELETMMAANNMSKKALNRAATALRDVGDLLKSAPVAFQNIFPLPKGHTQLFRRLDQIIGDVGGRVDDSVGEIESGDFLHRLADDGIEGPDILKCGLHRLLDLIVLHEHHSRLQNMPSDDELKFAGSPKWKKRSPEQKSVPMATSMLRAFGVVPGEISPEFLDALGCMFSQFLRNLLIDLLRVIGFDDQDAVVHGLVEGKAVSATLDKAGGVTGPGGAIHSFTAMREKFDFLSKEQNELSFSSALGQIRGIQERKEQIVAKLSAAFRASTALVCGDLSVSAVCKVFDELGELGKAVTGKDVEFHSRMLLGIVRAEVEKRLTRLHIDPAIRTEIFTKLEDMLQYDLQTQGAIEELREIVFPEDRADGQKGKLSVDVTPGSPVSPERQKNDRMFKSLVEDNSSKQIVQMLNNSHTCGGHPDKVQHVRDAVVSLVFGRGKQQALIEFLMAMDIDEFKARKVLSKAVSYVVCNRLKWLTHDSKVKKKLDELLLWSASPESNPKMARRMASVEKVAIPMVCGAFWGGEKRQLMSLLKALGVSSRRARKLLSDQFDGQNLSKKLFPTFEEGGLSVVNASKVEGLLKCANAKQKRKVVEASISFACGKNKQHDLARVVDEFLELPGISRISILSTIVWPIVLNEFKHLGNVSPKLISTALLRRLAGVIDSWLDRSPQDYYDCCHGSGMNKGTHEYLGEIKKGVHSKTLNGQLELNELEPLMELALPLICGHTTKSLICTLCECLWPPDAVDKKLCELLKLNTGETGRALTKKEKQKLNDELCELLKLKGVLPSDETQALCSPTGHTHDCKKENALGWAIWDKDPMSTVEGRIADAKRRATQVKDKVDALEKATMGIVREGISIDRAESLLQALGETKLEKDEALKGLSKAVANTAKAKLTARLDLSASAVNEIGTALDIIFKENVLVVPTNAKADTKTDAAVVQNLRDMTFEFLRGKMHPVSIIDFWAALNRISTGFKPYLSTPPRQAIAYKKVADPATLSRRYDAARILLAASIPELVRLFRRVGMDEGAVSLAGFKEKVEPHEQAWWAEKPEFQEKMADVDVKGTPQLEQESQDRQSRILRVADTVLSLVFTEPTDSSLVQIMVMLHADQRKTLKCLSHAVESAIHDAVEWLGIGKILASRRNMDSGNRRGCAALLCAKRYRSKVYADNADAEHDSIDSAFLRAGVSFLCNENPTRDSLVELLDTMGVSKGAGEDLLASSASDIVVRALVTMVVGKNCIEEELGTGVTNGGPGKKRSKEIGSAWKSPVLERLSRAVGAENAFSHLKTGIGKHVLNRRSLMGAALNSEQRMLLACAVQALIGSGTVDATTSDQKATSRRVASALVTSLMTLDTESMSMTSSWFNITVLPVVETVVNHILKPLVTDDETERSAKEKEVQDLIDAVFAPLHDSKMLHKLRLPEHRALLNAIVELQQAMFACVPLRKAHFTQVLELAAMIYPLLSKLGELKKLRKPKNDIEKSRYLLLECKPDNGSKNLAEVSEQVLTRLLNIITHRWNVATLNDVLPRLQSEDGLNVHIAHKVKQRLHDARRSADMRDAAVQYILTHSYADDQSAGKASGMSKSRKEAQEAQDQLRRIAQEWLIGIAVPDLIEFKTRLGLLTDLQMPRRGPNIGLKWQAELGKAIRSARVARRSVHSATAIAKAVDMHNAIAELHSHVQMFHGPYAARRSVTTAGGVEESGLEQTQPASQQKRQSLGTGTGGNRRKEAFFALLNVFEFLEPTDRHMLVAREMLQPTARFDGPEFLRGVDDGPILLRAVAETNRWRALEQFKSHELTTIEEELTTIEEELRKAQDAAKSVVKDLDATQHGELNAIANGTKDAAVAFILTWNGHFYDDLHTRAQRLREVAKILYKRVAFERNDYKRSIEKPVEPPKEWEASSEQQATFITLLNRLIQPVLSKNSDLEDAWDRATGGSDTLTLIHKKCGNGPDVAKMLQVEIEKGGTWAGISFATLLQVMAKIIVRPRREELIQWLLQALLQALVQASQDAPRSCETLMHLEQLLSMLEAGAGGEGHGKQKAQAKIEAGGDAAKDTLDMRNAAVRFIFGYPRGDVTDVSDEFTRYSAQQVRDECSKWMVEFTRAVCLDVQHSAVPFLRFPQLLTYIDSCARQFRFEPDVVHEMGKDGSSGVGNQGEEMCRIHSFMVAFKEVQDRVLRQMHSFFAIADHHLTQFNGPDHHLRSPTRSGSVSAAPHASGSAACVFGVVEAGALNAVQLEFQRIKAGDILRRIFDNGHWGGVSFKHFVELFEAIGMDRMRSETALLEALLPTAIHVCQKACERPGNEQHHALLQSIESHASALMSMAAKTMSQLRGSQPARDAATEFIFGWGADNAVVVGDSRRLAQAERFLQAVKVCVGNIGTPGEVR